MHFLLTSYLDSHQTLYELTVARWLQPEREVLLANEECVSDFWYIRTPPQCQAITTSQGRLPNQTITYSCYCSVHPRSPEQSPLNTPKLAR